MNALLGPAVIGFDCTNQEGIDKIMLELDGSDNKGTLGANAILGVSMAVCKAGAAAKGVPLYRHIADLAKHGKEPLMPGTKANDFALLCDCSNGCCGCVAQCRRSTSSTVARTPGTRWPCRNS